MLLSCHHIETSQLICSANQLTGFYMMAIAIVNAIVFDDCGVAYVTSIKCSETSRTKRGTGQSHKSFFSHRNKFHKSSKSN